MTQCERHEDDAPRIRPHLHLQGARHSGVSNKSAPAPSGSVQRQAAELIPLPGHSMPHPCVWRHQRCLLAATELHIAAPPHLALPLRFASSDTLSTPLAPTGPGNGAEAGLRPGGWLAVRHARRRRFQPRRHADRRLAARRRLNAGARVRVEAAGRRARVAPPGAARRAGAAGRAQARRQAACQVSVEDLNADPTSEAGLCIAAD